MTIYEHTKRWLMSCPALSGAAADMFGDHVIFRRYVRGCLRELCFSVSLHVPLADTDAGLETAARFFTEVDGWMRDFAPELGGGRVFCDFNHTVAPRCSGLDHRGCAVYSQDFRILYYEKGAA